MTIASIRFSAMSLSFPRGKVQITQDAKTGKSVIFSDWKLDTTKKPPQAKLLNLKNQVVATYPVRVTTVNGRARYIIDDLNQIGAQG